jgi:hypothetical protein
MRPARRTLAKAATSKAIPRSLLADLTAKLARLDPSGAVTVRASSAPAKEAKEFTDTNGSQ